MSTEETPRLIPASQELKDRMARLQQKGPVTFAQAKEQTEAAHALARDVDIASGAHQPAPDAARKAAKDASGTVLSQRIDAAIEEFQTKAQVTLSPSTYGILFWRFKEFRERELPISDDSTAALRREVEELQMERDAITRMNENNRVLFDKLTAQLSEVTRERDEVIAAFNSIGEAIGPHTLEAESLVMSPGQRAVAAIIQINEQRDAALARAEAGAEALAEMIYDIDRACDPEGSKYPWQKGGNSLKQDEARRKARAAIDANGEGEA